MPWMETAPVEERERFIADVGEGLYSMTELCERYGISRKSAYKWLDRFAEGGRRRRRARAAPQPTPMSIQLVTYTEPLLLTPCDV